MRKARALRAYYFSLQHLTNVNKTVGITQLYNKFFEEPTSQIFKLHAQLDRQVMQAYGFIDSDDILAKVLELNLEVAEKEKRGEPVVGPCVPTYYKY